VTGVQTCALPISLGSTERGCVTPSVDSISFHKFAEVEASSLVQK
jgi:hypothetical protein